MINNSLNFLLWQTHMVWQRKLNRIVNQFSISYSQYIILLSINFLNENKIKANQVELIKFTNLDKMTMSQAIAKLTKEGHIKQMRDKKDRRSKNLILNGSGFFIISRLIIDIENLEKKFFSEINKEAKQELDRLLTVILNDNLNTS